MTITGLFYPLEVTGSGDVRAASTLTNELVESYCRYILDTEAPFTLFETVPSEAISLGLEKFRYSLSSKVPAMVFIVTARMEGSNQMLITVEWNEQTITIAVEVTT